MPTDDLRSLLQELDEEIDVLEGYNEQITLSKDLLKQLDIILGESLPGEGSLGELSRKPITSKSKDEAQSLDITSNG